MPVDGVNASEGARVEQLNSPRSEEARVRQQRQDDQQVEARRAAEEGRGQNMDITA